MTTGWSVKNPATGNVIEEIRLLSDSQIDEFTNRAQAAYHHWKNTSSAIRAQVLVEIATSLRRRREDFARRIVRESGKPVSLARNEVDRAAFVFDWAAGEAVRFSGELLRPDAQPGLTSSELSLGITQWQPKGVLLGITPFNFPLNLVAHKIAPALAAGCSVLIKPSPLAPRTARLLIHEVARAVRKFTPIEDVAQWIPASDLQTAALTRDPRVSVISFTGSSRVGWMIRDQTPRKPVTLELGGNAWCIVTPEISEDLLESIAQKLIHGAFNYAGQSCISVQNIAIHEDVAPRLLPHLKQAVRSYTWGEPTRARTLCGPVISGASGLRLKELLSNVPSSAKTTTPPLAGSLFDPSVHAWVEPTLIDLGLIEDFATHPQLTDEEVFGPIATVGRYQDLDALIAQVNRGSFGLQAGIFSQSIQTVLRAYRQLDVGGVIANNVPTTRYDHQPYGGTKESGLGREGIRFAMEEFSDRKFLALR